MADLFLPAALLARVRLHEVVPGPGVVRKRRRPGAALLLGPGNLLAARRAVPVEVLDEAPWQARELEVARALGRRASVEPGGWLRMERLPGSSLATLLGDPSVAEADRLEAVRLAGRALVALHAVLGGSHGDATAANVACDLSTCRAEWHDFDAAHRPGPPSERLRADDLRALCFSACRGAGDAAPSAIVAAALDAVDESPVRRELRALVEARSLRLDLWHLAQAASSPARHDECRRALLRALGSATIRGPDRPPRPPRSR